MVICGTAGENVILAGERRFVKGVWKESPV